MPAAPPRPLRSALFVPAAKPRALEKSAGLAVDALIFDLEDSAAREEKEGARERLAAQLAALPDGGPFRVARVNALGEGGAEDIAALSGLGAVLLPKVESAAMLAALDEGLTGAGAPEALELWAMVETPRGILAAQEIAAARLSRPVGALVVGPNDIVLSTGIRLSPGRPELVPWLMQVVLAAKAAGVAVLDGVYNDFRDAEGLARECAQARALGFAGKTLIHPNQIGAANAAFAPSAGEIAAAERIVAAFALPAHAGRGVISLDGRMVERLHLEEARALLAFRDRLEN